MRKCRACSKKYTINTKHAGCCSLNCYKIRRKKITMKQAYLDNKNKALNKFMKEQLERALKK